MALMRSPQTRYVLVASPQRDTVDEASFFAQRLREVSTGAAALVVNRCTPTFPRPSTKLRAADAALWANYDELVALAAVERAQLAGLRADVADAPAVWVPLLADDVHDLDGLDAIRQLLFDSATSAG